MISSTQDIGSRRAIKIFDQAFEMTRQSLVIILARDARLKFRPSLGRGPSAASHDNVKRCLLFLEMLALVESESESCFGAQVSHRRPAGLHSD